MLFARQVSRLTLAVTIANGVAGTAAARQAPAAPGRLVAPPIAQFSTLPVAPGAPDAATPAYLNAGASFEAAPTRCHACAVATATAAVGPQPAARGIADIDGLARITPLLLSGSQGGAVQGGNITIRGFSGPDQSPFGGQAVSFSIDGVQVAKAMVRPMTDLVIGQIMMLKGPQALFFGRNSPAGIIPIHTADPADRLGVNLSGGYEFNARQMRTEGYVSCPISDTRGSGWPASTPT